LSRNQPTRVIITGGAGGQAAHFLRLCKKRKKRIVVVGIIEGHNREEALLRAKKAGEQCRVFETVAEAIAAGLEFEAGIVCSRPEAHAAEIIALLNAHNYVLAEKPPTHTLEEMVAVAVAEHSSRGCVDWNFQLDEQWGGLRERIEDREHGQPLVVEAVWVRGRLSDEDQLLLESVRRGQRGRPIVDLCHMVHAAIMVLPGARPVSVVGESWTERDGDRITAQYETLTATALFPWNGKLVRVQLRVVCGFNIPLPGEHTTEEVYVATQGFRGTERINLLVDERVIGGRPLAPRHYWPRRTVLSLRGYLEDRSVKSPQPKTVLKCYAAKLDAFLTMIESGTRVSGADEGLAVMQLIDAFLRSDEAGEQVLVTPVEYTT
jgi:predicted dehydrogenase